MYSLTAAYWSHFSELCAIILADISYMFSSTASLWGSDPGTINVFSNVATVEFFTDYSVNYNGFNATYTAFNTSVLNSKYSL